MVLVTGIRIIIILYKVLFRVLFHLLLLVLFPIKHVVNYGKNNYI